MRRNAASTEKEAVMTEKRRGRRTQVKGVKDLANGLYLVRARGWDSSGRPIERERKVQAKSIREAQLIKFEFERELSEHTPKVSEPAAPKRVGELSRAWLEHRQQMLRRDGTPRLAPSTRVRYEHTVSVLIEPYLGEVSLDALTRRMVERWRDHLGAHFASATVNGALNVLRSILRDADCRAADGVRPLEQDDTRITDDEPNALDEEELQAFVKAAREFYPQHMALILVLLTTGQRISTVLALRHEDIDRARHTITFRRRLSEGELLPGVKRSRKAHDVAPLLEEVAHELDKAMATQSEEQAQSGLVFPAEDGRHHARTLLREPFKRILAHAGITKRFTPHGCRRTAAAFYRRVAGSAVSKAIVGHTTDRMHEHYAVVSSEEKRTAAKGAFRLLQGGDHEKWGIGWGIRSEDPS